jgi:hypothetical protein
MAKPPIPLFMGRALGIFLVAGLVLGAVAPVAAKTTAPGAASQSVQASGRFKINLYEQGSFVTQYTWTWCVGATSQMMLNLIKDTSNRTKEQQKKLVQYAMAHDGHAGSQGGSDATGFAATLREHGGGSYRPVTYSSFRKSVRKAVKAIRHTGKPVGLLVMGGRHAWVLHGFEATRDPARTNDFEVTHVYVSGPLYPKQTSGYFDRPPNTRLTIDQFRTPFRRFDDPDSPEFVGYWVTVNP